MVSWTIPEVLGVVAAAIVLVGLVRGKLPDAYLLTGIVLLPAVAYAMANVVLMERSKATEFCVSCHVMVPIAESLEANDGSLASKHIELGAVPAFQSCYTCHSGYGIWGNVEAKTAGIFHMLHEITGRYEFPLKMRGPFNIDSCLACHAESIRFRGAVQHQIPSVQEALLSREMLCTGACHPAAHPPEALSGEGLER